MPQVYVLSSLSNWIDKRKNEITNFSDYDEGKLIIFGAEAVESFKDYEFGPGETFEKFKVRNMKNENVRMHE